MEITNKTSYSDLKKWFLEQLEKNVLPVTLDNSFCYYSHVESTVKMYIEIIDNEFEEKDDKSIKTSKVAIAYKNNLYSLYVALQDKSRWNAPMKRIDEINE